MQIKEWSRIASISPKLQQHIQLYPQYFRGEKWYILHDKSNEKFIRFNAVAYDFIARLNGISTIEQIWSDISRGETDLTQEDLMSILSQLFAVYAVTANLSIDANAFFEKYKLDQKNKQKHSLSNPLSLKFSLFNPNKLLDRLLPFAKPFISQIGGAIWAVTVGIALILALANINTIGAAFNSDIIAPTNLFVMIITFIVIKTLHEFAHALFIKSWGGDVTEMGITFLVFSPIPYVNASASTAFRSKYKRALVAASGILVELFLAALAFLLWLIIEPSFIKDIAFNVFFIASFSTLIFNGNPLLRFDGYHILQDLIEIPNLYSRSSKYLKYIMQKYIFRLSNVLPIYRAPGETKWFVFYGIFSFIYRYVLLFSICVLVINEYFFVGVALSIWLILNQIFKPVCSGLLYLLVNPNLNGDRVKSIALPSLICSLFIVFITLIPVSRTTDTQGIVWVKEQAEVFAEANGFVEKVYVTNGSKVKQGTLLLKLESYELEHKISILKAQVSELRVQYQSDLMLNRIKSKLLAQEISQYQAELDYALEQHKGLTIYSQVSGTFVALNRNDLIGQYFKQGEPIGYVISPDELVIKAVLEQADIGLVRQSIVNVDARLAEHMTDSFSVNLSREIPTATSTLPSSALGSLGGGEISVIRDSGKGLTAANKIFQVELTFPKGKQVIGIGERVYLRIEHLKQPMFYQWWHNLRQLFLSQLSV